MTTDPDRGRGYVVWDFEVTEIQQCSTIYTNVIHGNLDIVTYASAVSKDQELIIRQAVLAVLQPVNGSGDTEILGAYQLTNTYLHWLKVFDVTELFVEKTGRSTPETVGTQISCLIKVSL